MYLEDSKKEKTNMLMCLKVDENLKSLLIKYNTFFPYY